MRRSAGDVNRTQEAILAAYAELIEELGTDDVSFRLIARRAGVGERTIFRNYATRVDLLLATAAWIEQQDLPAPGLAEHLRHARSRSARRWSRTTIDRSSRTSWPRPRCAGSAAPRPARAREMLEEMIDAEVPSLGDAERRAIVSALAHLDSAATWVTFRREFGMTRSDIADAAAWAAEAVLDPIRSRVG